MARRGAWAAAIGAVVLAAAAPPDFSRVDLLDGYAPAEVAPGDPGAHPLAVAAPGDAALDAGAMARAQSYSDDLGGLALLVWRRGALRYERYADGIGEDTRFETFSMHKSVLALVYGAAIRDGVIGSIDDPAARYLPEWAHDARGAITLRELLGMRSGLHVYARDEPPGAQLARGGEASKAALDDRAERPPSERFDYNGANMQVAGHILNQELRRSGQGDYASYLSRVLLRPLGAGDAHLWLEHEGGDPRFFAHLQMRARDWLRVGIMLAGRGRFDGAQVLPAAWIREVETPSPLNPNYGLGVWLGSPWTRYREYSPAFPVKMSHEAPYLAPDVVYFDGFGGERVYVSRSADLVIVRVGQPRFDYDDSVIPNAVLRAAGAAP